MLVENIRIGIDESKILPGYLQLPAETKVFVNTNENFCNFAIVTTKEWADYLLDKSTVAPKQILKYEEKEYQLSICYLKNMNLYEVMIFPVENNIVSGNEVYCFRTMYFEEITSKQKDILENLDKYLSDNAIEKYFACKKCKEWCCTMCPYFQ